MRVRPFFWLLLAASCIGVLIFAANWQAHVPAVMQVHVEQQPSASANYTRIHLHLTDEQGLPIEAAQIVSQANMTNMNMVSNQSSIRYLGQGNYVAQLRLYMAGPWLITIQAHADGFDMPQQLNAQIYVKGNYCCYNNQEQMIFLTQSSCYSTIETYLST